MKKVLLIGVAIAVVAAQVDKSSDDDVETPPKEVEL